MRWRKVSVPVVVLFVVLAVLAGLGGGMLLDEPLPSPTNPSPGVPSAAAFEFRLAGEASEIIRREYVDQASVESRRLTQGAISGMIAALGGAGAARFLTPQMAQRQENHTLAKFAGIGAYVEMRDGRAVIVAPLDDSPAERGGLEPGDVILEVDGEDVTGLRLDEVQGRIMGPVGTKVTLKTQDPVTGNALVATLERAEIKLDLVTWKRIPGTSTAHVRISAFSEGASEDLARTLAEIEEQPIKGLILDLRNNTGGLVQEAVGVTSQFVETGNVLLKKDAQGQTTAVPVEEHVQAVNTPTVVLVNGATGSAAEVVTGALQDHGRAVVVGTATLGAGVVLNEFVLSDGSVLLLPVEEWLTPDGRAIWQQGLAPDVEVALSSSAQPLVRLHGRDITAEQVENSGDLQLLHALDLLSTERQRASSAVRI
jgi:carboxyl-terminal processing protease